MCEAWYEDYEMVTNVGPAYKELLWGGVWNCSSMALHVSWPS